MSKLFKAWLKGSHVEPSVSTEATGKALFKFKRVNNHYKLYFLVKVRNIQNVEKIDLHLGSRDNNGPRIYTLYGPTSPGISVDKGVVYGKIHPRYFAGPLSGHSLFKLFKLFIKGRVYVNVHTAEYPRGEIRGQVKKLHHHNHNGNRNSMMS